MRVIKVKDWGDIPRDYTGIVEYFDGYKAWYLNGHCHREDGPAVEWWDGSKFWYLNGHCHREDGPALKWADGSKEWYLNGKRHREEGPAIEYSDGSKFWYLNDELLFKLPPKSQPFLLLEAFVDEEGKGQLKVLTQQGIEIWKNVPGLKEYAENWESVKR